MKEYDEKSILDKVTEQISLGMNDMGEDFTHGAAVVGCLMATQAAINTTVQWAQDLEDKGSLLDNFTRLYREKKTALGGGGYAAIKTVANAFGAVKNCAEEAIEKTNQQLEAGTLTKTPSGTTLFGLGREKKSSSTLF
jgi:hypothetical protein